MSHLLAISVGPVQEFIKSARRTRDLWYGSHLLSRISRVVAERVQGAGGELIFPAELTAGARENVANVILAYLGSADPQDVARRAKQAAEDEWKAVAERVLRDAAKEICEATWKEQEEDVIEFYSAWVRHEDPEKYRDDRARVMRLLSGRKNLRDFAQGKQTDIGKSKSSLDGLRASVLKSTKGRKEEATPTRRKLRLNGGEQLDIVGVVKRLGEGARPYPSVARIAADPWVRGIVECGGSHLLSNLIEKCGTLPAQGLRI